MVLHNFTNNNNSNNGNNGGNIPTKTPTFGNQYRPNSTPTTDDIPSCLVNLNEKFQHASHCLYREDVIDQTLATLIGTEKTESATRWPCWCWKNENRRRTRTPISQQ